MKSKEALSKALIWRFLVAIPFSTAISLFYLDDAGQAVELAIVTNIVATILYYLFDLFWFRWISKKFD